MIRKRLRPVSLALLGCAVLGLTFRAEAAPDLKEEATPCFWQRDSRAGFANQGREYCAPTAVSNGLLYLARARGLRSLASDWGPEAQIRLIKELAREMGTDPKSGTNPDKIVTGLKRHVATKGLDFQRLELATWRPLSSANKRYKVATRPNLEWVMSAVKDPDCVVVFNVGWYDWDEEEESYRREGGHWITVVAQGTSKNQFHVHNPSLAPDVQAERVLIRLKAVDKDFSVLGSDDEEKNMSGYYEVSGPGLPMSDDNRSALLDCVIVFRLRR